MDLLELVLDKRELRGISRDFAAGVLKEYLRRNPKIKDKYEEDPERFDRTKDFQKLRSDVRERLREVYGVFFTPAYAAKREKHVEALIQAPDHELSSTVLSLHRSTAERLMHYPFLYKQLFDITGMPDSVLDLGCGFNPFSYPFMPNRPSYHSADIACSDLELIGKFMESLGIAHSEHCIDLSDPESVKGLPSVDLAFAFKVFDSLETLNRNVTRELLESIPAKKIIVSFPTLSIGQGTSIRPRQWFEELVTGKVLGRVTLPNEQFVIITGQHSFGVTENRQ